MTGAEPAGTSEAENSASKDEIEALRWSVRPLDKSPEKVWGVWAGAIAALLLGVLLLKQALPGAIGFAIILGSTAEYWLGTSYKVDSKGASARTGLSVTAIAWEDVKRVIVEPDGIKLSPLEAATRMDAFRGVWLKFADTNREEVTETVRRFVADDARFLEG